MAAHFVSFATLCALVAVVAAAPKPAGEKYTTKYDNVNLEQILHNDRLLESYFNCLMDKGRCTPDGEELKKNIPDALENECAKCSPKQRAEVERVMKFLKEEKPKYFEEFEKKWDPKGTYRQRYRKTAEKHGIKV